jgi:cytochrome P450
LILLCRLLNEAGAEYVVIGGWAVIQYGYGRTTGDVDLIVDTSPKNFEKVKKAMLGLPDGAIKEVQPGDLDQYVVIRVADEFVVDLMKAACGIDYAEAKKSIQWFTVRNVKIPFANPELLLRTKQTYRDKDSADRDYLRDLINKREWKG